MSDESLDSRAHVPATTLRLALPQLRRPFAPEVIRFVPFAEFKKRDEPAPYGARVAAYVETLTVIERLHLVLEDLWQTEYHEVAGNVVCRLTIDGHTRSNAGESRNGKGNFSDALKRAALMFGVGQYLRRMSTVPLYVERGKHRLELKSNRIELPEASVEGLRADYARWLEAKAIPEFGAVLHHWTAEPDHEELPDFDPDTGEVLAERSRSLEHLPEGARQSQLQTDGAR